MTTKALTRIKREMERAVNKALAKYSNPKPVKKVKAKVVRRSPAYTKHHAGIDGVHHEECRGWILGLHCRYVITEESARKFLADKDRVGQTCKLCLPHYAGWRGWDDVFNGPVCSNHFHFAMKQKARERRAARRR